jgi:hypothetical protein
MLFIFRPGFLFAHGAIGWDQFHIMISRSTTPDIFKMVAKIEEFITMQFTSSRRVLSAFGPIGSKRSPDRQKADDEDECEYDPALNNILFLDTQIQLLSWQHQTKHLNKLSCQQQL